MSNVSIGTGITVANIREIIKDLQDCCNKCDCSLDTSVDKWDSYLYVNADTRKAAEKAVNLFKETYRCKYGEIIDEIFAPLNSKEFRSCGWYCSESLNDVFDILLDDFKVLEAKTSDFVGDVDDLLAKLYKIHEGVCLRMGIKTSDFPILTVKNIGYMVVLIPCSDADFGKKFADEWNNYCIDQKMNAVFFDWSSVEWIFQDNLVEMDGKNYLKGWIVYNKEV